jgi:hypothetical protein
MFRFVQHAALALLAISLALVVGTSRDPARLGQGSTERPLVATSIGQRATTVDLAHELRQRLLIDGGCTLDPRTAQPVGTIDAYAVSVEGYEARFDDLPSLEQIEDYLRRHSDVLCSEQAIHVGAWRDSRSGECYLDLSELVTGRAAAEHRGRARRQRCIYHLATGTEIRLR